MAQFNPLLPYNDLPLLPPNANIETYSILKQCIEARSALAELKQIGKLIPNQDVLINSIPLREAKDSSEIENIVTTTDELFQFAATQNDKATTSTKETLRYRTALFEGYEDIQNRPLSAATTVRTCQKIRGVNVDIRDTLGTALKSSKTGEIIYTPPEGEDLLREKLKNWEFFINNETKIDPLVRMAVGHYQFEAIHPFTDGNGRTGRIFNILFLISQELLDIPVLYMSGYIIENKDDYYRLLQEVTSDEKWEEWILFMVRMVEKTAKWTTAKIQAISQLMEYTCEYVKQKEPAIYQRELIDLIFTQPYSRIGYLVDANLAKRRTASAYLKKMCSIGILREMKIGRDKFFIHPKFLNLLMSDSNEFRHYG